MPTVDEYGFPPDDPAEARRGSPDLRTWRSRLRAQGREIRELRAALAADEAAAEPADTPTVGEAGRAERAALVAELDEVRGATAQIEAEYVALTHEPVGVSLEDRRAAELVQLAAEGAMPQVDGLEGMLARLQDRSVPYEQLQAEMAVFGFRDAPPPTS